MSPLIEEDLRKGSNFLVKVDGKAYPMEFVEFMRMSFNFVQI